MTRKRVVWKEGMLLRPQHFQQQDRYLEYQIRERTQRLGQYSWGFFMLHMDNAHLKESKVVLDRAEGIMPDGSLFAVESTMEVDIPPGQGSVSVYLGVALATNNKKETRDIDHKEAARYVTCEHQLEDTYIGHHSKCDMVCSTHDLRLLIGNEPDQAQYIKLKVCEVRVAENGLGISLVEDFTPSFLYASSHKVFGKYLNEVMGMLDARGEQLAQRVGTVGQAGGAEIGDFMMLQVVNHHEVQLERLQSGYQVSPETIHHALATLLGDLSVFNTGTKRPERGLTYTHDNQNACLRTVVQAISDLLAMVLEQHAIRLPIQQGEFGVMVAKMTDHSLPDTSFFVLVASADCDTEQLRSRLPAQLKVGTVETLRQMVTLHLPGIKIAPLAVAPRQLPFHAHKAYFRLEADAQQMASLGATAGVAMHLSGEMDGFELELWAIRKSAS